MKFPFTIRGLDWETKGVKPVRPAGSARSGTVPGDFVAVRPKGAGYDGRTWLGIYIGEMAQAVKASRRRDTDHIAISYALWTPLIFIPDLRQSLPGTECWWAKLESPEKLRDICDGDITDVWYARAMEQLARDARRKAEADAARQRDESRHRHPPSPPRPAPTSRAADAPVPPGQARDAQTAEPSAKQGLSTRPGSEEEATSTD